MFLSTKVLSKLMKEAYKVRLEIGNVYDGIIIIAAEWAVWLSEEFVPKKVKALIMELAGEIPDQNILFSICKDRPDPQYEVVTNAENLFEEINLANKKLFATPIVINRWTSIKLFQADNNLRSIVGVNQSLIELIDKSEIDYNYEGDPIGPCYAYDPYSPIYWYNQTCKVLIRPNKYESNEIFDALSDIDFSDRDKKRGEMNAEATLENDEIGDSDGEEVEGNKCCTEEQEEPEEQEC